ncbi:PREDICTED: uncharacterized protein LOC109152793 [Ipomoea nil]|uniref:uncharacterized protein LOC109152793 n=1 Tax=Ipomoea nil TaxID=35883 RepID=UPI000901A591|nr:PREDICTED: uncharacterized protein LOC109152793 [Ipomoea nil]
MSEKSKDHKKCYVSDEQISSLLQRYTLKTVLALLEEVDQAKEVKYDWNALVKKTKTGITNAREYQMLWRHLAYGHAFVDGLVDEAQPLDDASDLECELEAYPAVNSEASAEASAFVKVLVGSGTANDSHTSNGMTVEAPLTISIPNGQRSINSSGTSDQSISMQESKVIIPVFVSKKPLANAISTKGLDTNGPSDANLPPPRKRKFWSETEDMELIAAVKKRGEGNWASISKGEFKGDRTASQLSKRWAVLRKQQGALVGNNSELSEMHLAHRAMSLALDVPMGDNSKAASSIRSEGTNANAASGNPAKHLAYDTSSVNTKSQHQGQQDFASNAAPKLATLGPSKLLVSEKPSTKPNISTNLMVKAAAVAAGARIASPSDAASLFRAAQSTNAVHISTGGGPLIKSSFSGNTNALSSNVHLIRTSLPSNSTSLLSGSRTEPRPVQCQSVNPASPVVQSNVVGMASGLNASTKVVSNGTHSNPVAEFGIKNVKEKAVSSLEIVTEKVVPQQNQATCPHIASEGDQISASTRNALVENAQGDQIAVPGNSSREKIGMTCVSDDPVKENGQRNHKASFEVLLQD